MSCAFRQTNIIWVAYAYVYSQLRILNFSRYSSGNKGGGVFCDPPATEAKFGKICIYRTLTVSCIYVPPEDWLCILKTIPNIPFDVVTSALPYAVDATLFIAFVIWNGGIVLGRLHFMRALFVLQTNNSI